MDRRYYEPSKNYDCPLVYANGLNLFILSNAPSGLPGGVLETLLNFMKPKE